MEDQAEEQEGMYFCGICGWVAIENYPHCHSTFTPVASVEQEAQRMIDAGMQGVYVENGVIFYCSEDEEQEA